MAEFSNLIITSKGQTLINKALANECNLSFTKVTTSDQIYTLAQLQSLTSLTIKQSTLISRIYTDSTKVNIEAAFNNISLSDGYYLRNIGLYANDPDEGEVLFALAKETSENCYMPSYNGVTTSGISLKLILNNSNSDIVSIEVDPAALATAAEVTELRKQLQYIASMLCTVTELSQQIRSLSARLDALENS